MPGLILNGIFDWNLFVATLWVVPLIPLLILVGRYMVVRINYRAFDRLMLVLLTLASFILLFVAPR
jgi:hypothetical protein